MIKETSVSVGRACRVIGLNRSRWYYTTRKNDGVVIQKLLYLVEQFPTRGFDKYFAMIRNEGLEWGRSSVLRVYRELKLCHRRKHKRRLPSRIKEPLQKQTEANYSYSIDFMSDSLVYGRRLRIFNVMDDCTRESLAVWCDYSITGERVTEILSQIIAERSKPKQIRVDNGPEFTGKAFTSWCQQQGIIIKFIQPGRPMQNAYIERFNLTFREDVLDAYLFESLEGVRILSDEWQEKYNNLQPHESLKGKTPAMYRKSLSAFPLKRTIEHEL